MVLMPWREISTSAGAALGLAKPSRIGPVHLRTGIGLALSSLRRSALSSKARAAPASTSRDCACAAAGRVAAVSRRQVRKRIIMRSAAAAILARAATVASPAMRAGEK
jgi:hypothetical protein